MVRLDMSEYMEKHSVSRLVGAPPGEKREKEGVGTRTSHRASSPFSATPPPHNPPDSSLFEHSIAENRLNRLSLLL